MLKHLAKALEVAGLYSMLTRRQKIQADLIAAQEEAHAQLGVLFSHVLADALLPHLDGHAKRNLRLACKAARDILDGTIDRVTVTCPGAVGSPIMPPPALARWAGSVREVKMEFEHPAWLRFLRSAGLSKLMRLHLSWRASRVCGRNMHGGHQ